MNTNPNDMDYDNLANSSASTSTDQQPAGDGGGRTEQDPDAALDDLAQGGEDLGGAVQIAKKTTCRAVIKGVKSVVTNKDDGGKTKVVIDLEVIGLKTEGADQKIIGTEHSLWCCVGGRAAQTKEVTRGKTDLYKLARKAGHPLDPGDLRKTVKGAKMTEALVGAEVEIVLAPGQQGGTFVNV